MRKETDVLFKKISHYLSDQDLIEKITQNFNETLTTAGLIPPPEMKVVFNETKDGVVVSSGIDEQDALYTLLANKCALEVIESELGEFEPQFKNSLTQHANRFTSSNFFTGFFYLFNSLFIIGSLFWVFSVLSSADFRAWYMHEAASTGSALLIYTFLLLLPAILIASSVGAYWLKKRGNEVSLGAILFKFELPAMLVLLLAKEFIINVPLTDGLRLFGTFLLVIILIDWFVRILKIRFSSISQVVARLASIVIYAQTILYATLAVSIPFVVFLIIEREIIDFLFDAFEYIIRNPFYLIVSLLILAACLVPLVLPYVLFKLLHKDYWTLTAQLTQLTHLAPRINNIILVTVPTLFMLVLILGSRVPTMGTYGEQLILLAGADQTYSTLAARAALVISNQKSIEKRLDYEYSRYDKFMFDSSDFNHIAKTNPVFAAYTKTVWFPFVDPVDRGVLSKNRTAYQKGYERAFGEQYSFNSSSRTELRQVKHLSRDIFVDTNDSELLAKVTVTDSFSTFVDRDQEVIVEFSLPENAVITDLKLGSSLQYQGQIAPRGAAEQVYVEQVRRQIDPALLEQVGPRQYRLRVYPVPAQNKIADRQRVEKVDGEVQRVQFSYIVMRDSMGIPLPETSQAYNILSSETKYAVNLNGQPTTMTATKSHVSDPQSVVDLCNGVKRISVTTASYQKAEFVVGKVDSDRVCTEANLLFATITGKHFQIYLDASFKNRDGALTASLEQLRSLPTEFYVNNTVELIPYSSVVGKTTRLYGPEDVPRESDLVFFGKSALYHVLSSSQLKYADGVIVLAGKTSDFVQTHLPLSPYQLDDVHISIVHTPNHIPAYGANIEPLFKNTASFSVFDNLDEALQTSSLLLTERSHPKAMIGEYWSLQLVNTVSSAIPYATTSTSTRLVSVVAPLPVKSTEEKMLEKIALRADIKARNRTSGVSYDFLHNLAKQAGVVTSLSSYIALVNDEQQRRLNQLSAQSDSFTSQQRFMVTQPRVNNPLSGGMLLSNSTGLSAGDATMTTLDMSGGGGLTSGGMGHSGVWGDAESDSTNKGMTLPIIIFILLVIAGAGTTVLMVVRKFKE